MKFLPARVGENIPKGTGTLFKGRIVPIIVGTLLLSSLLGALVLVKENQELRQKAATIDPCEDGPGGCCNAQCPCQDWEECAVSNGACSSGKSCRIKDCSAGGSSCSENWQCCSGYCTNGLCDGDGGGGGGGFVPRSPSEVCSDSGGTVVSNCSADPNCQSNGGVCCGISSLNHCCYGDSQTRKDGACYAGGLQTNITCSGRTMTNNTSSPVRVWVFKGRGTCPFSSPSGEKILAAGASFTASCEQLDVPGSCGVCDDSTCSPSTATGTPVPPTNTSTPTKTPTPTQTPTGTLVPTNTPTQTPTQTPTMTPTKTPSPTQTPTGTLVPTNTPTQTPTQTPTMTPTLTPTPVPGCWGTCQLENPNCTGNLSCQRYQDRYYCLSTTCTPDEQDSQCRCPAPTTPPPTAVPTREVLPDAGIELPAQILTIGGGILTLLGLLLLL